MCNLMFLFHMIREVLKSFHSPVTIGVNSSVQICVVGSDVTGGDIGLDKPV